MNKNNFSAAITMKEISRTYSHRGTQVLLLSARYPQVVLCNNPAVQGNINRYIIAQINDYMLYAANDLYWQAVASYNASGQNSFPFHCFETVMNYEIAYNQNCNLSLYRDRYEFTGGAHGSTIRLSDTWNLSTGCKLSLSSFFDPGEDYTDFLLSRIINQADQNMAQNPGIYFEEYHTLIADNFNKNSFYLTPLGLAIYYQQYEIAPYATGIVVFIIPYHEMSWQPSC